ncbi:MAG TPA: SigE family RNA polymerase sigma factor [Streptosporangiaceae bacterium]|nr:SigE family RNA polymerase sigma factor [Streptosporangiaceae bacterium]
MTAASGTGVTVKADSEDFDRFVDLRQRALLRSAWLLTGDWGLAEDLVQTALARTWLRWGRITRRDDPEIYVRRVMVSTWINWSRRKWRGERPGQELPDGPAPGDLATEAVARVAVRSALGSLTDRQRAVLVLRVFDDLTEAQTAQVLGCAVGTVKSTMSQALARLRTSGQLAEAPEREHR